MRASASASASARERRRRERRRCGTTRAWVTVTVMVAVTTAAAVTTARAQGWERRGDVRGGIGRVDVVLVRESRLGVGRRVRARRERRDHGESLDQGDVFRDVEPRNERVGERRTGNEHVGWESRRRWRRDGDDEVNPDGRVDASNACATNCPIARNR